MTNQHPDTNRTPLALNVAAEQCNLPLTDFFRYAESGALIIYVVADHWKAKRIKETDLTVDVSAVSPTISFRGPPLPEIPSPDDADFEEKCRERIRLEQAQDILCGNVIEYGRYGSFRMLYEAVFTGFQPVAACTFREYLVNPDSAAIILDLNRYLGLSHYDHERLAYLDRTILVRDAMHSGNLCVMAEDLKQLLEQQPG